MNGESLIGKVLGGRYELLEVIGSGGMATVFKAHCRFLDRKVAVKIIRDSLTDDPEALEKFDAEARAAASLSHHNIVSIYDVGEVDSLRYIVMELVEGMTLKEYIKKKGALDWQEACDFAIQIAAALECAHANGVIHRDIKPHNILLTKDGTLKVADFGIARTTTSDTLVAGKGTSVMGSVHYVSPEQARGGYVDKKSDVYSLGVVFYEMLAGRVPFDGENPVSVAVMKLEQEPPNCKIHNPDIPQAVAEIAMKAIAKEQHSRYQSAMEMATDIQALLAPKVPEHKEKADGQGKDTGGLEDKITRFLLIGSLVLALILGCGAYYLFSGGTKEYQVPDLMNLTLEEAMERAVEYDFIIDEEKVIYQVSEDVPEGRVMRQEPGANDFTKKNKIRVVISSGKEEGKISVPSVVGKDIEEAIEILTGKKLKYRQVMERNNSYNVDEVFGQSPKADTKVNEDTVIVLHVCDGPVLEETEEPGETVTVPYVIGYDKEKAQSMLKAAGLTADIKEEESEKEAGTVTGQSPKAESMAPKGSSVSIVVSKGPAPTEAPAVSSPEPTPEVQKPTGEPLKQKTLTIPLSESLGETVQIKVVANGKVIWDKKHQTSEGKVDIPVASRTDATVEVYFDGVLQTTKVVTF